MKGISKHFILITLVVFIVSCKKNNVQSIDNIITSENGWKVQSISGYSEPLNDYSNAKMIFHYKQVGDFYFEDGQKGVYTYLGKDYPFIWSLSVNKLKIFISDLEDYTSPFLYYYFGGYESSPFESSNKDRIAIYQIERVNEYTIMFKHIGEPTNKQSRFSGLEILLTRND